MNNILIGVKRFFQNKNTVTLIALVACIGIIYFGYNARIKSATTPMNVPYATREIGPRTYITSEMVGVRKIPGGAVTKGVITNTNNIIGRYVSNKAVVPEGGLFYDTMVIDWEDFPTSMYADIPDGYTVYNLKVDVDKTYGNSIYPGNYIDIYFNTTASEGGKDKVWIGKFVENIKVFDVVNTGFKGVFETNGEPLTPAYIVFAVPDEIYLLFMKIESLGLDLFPVQRNAKYANSSEAKEMKIIGTEFVKYVEDRYVPDDVVEGGNN